VYHANYTFTIYQYEAEYISQERRSEKEKRERGEGGAPLFWSQSDRFEEGFDGCDNVGKKLFHVHTGFLIHPHCFKK
jgi:hypothetical protein